MKNVTGYSEISILMNIVGLMKQMTPLFLHNKSKVIIACKNKGKELLSF